MNNDYNYNNNNREVNKNESHKSYILSYWLFYVFIAVFIIFVGLGLVIMCKNRRLNQRRHQSCENILDKIIKENDLTERLIENKD